jgi:hypothetical protein
MSLIQTSIVVGNFDVILSLISSQKVATICFFLGEIFSCFSYICFLGEIYLVDDGYACNVFRHFHQYYKTPVVVLGWSLRSNSAGEKCKIVSETQHD